MPTKTKTKTKIAAPTVRVTLSTFDDSVGRPTYRAVRTGVKLDKFKAVTGADYNPAGMTPLLDATVEFVEHLRKLRSKDEVNVGVLLDESGSMEHSTESVIASVNKFVDGLREVETVDPKTAGKGFLVICTDGLENASKRHGYEQVRKLIGKCEKDGWILMFLGASIDAWGQGSALGFSGLASGQTVSTVSTPAGHASAFAMATNDGVGYLSDSAAYRTRRSTSSVRCLSEDGKETVLTPSGKVPEPVIPDPPAWKGEFDPSAAVATVTDELGE